MSPWYQSSLATKSILWRCALGGRIVGGVGCFLHEDAGVLRNAARSRQRGHAPDPCGARDTRPHPLDQPPGPRPLTARAFGRSDREDPGRCRMRDEDRRDRRRSSRHRSRCGAGWSTDRSAVRAPRRPADRRARSLALGSVRPDREERAALRPRDVGRQVRRGHARGCTSGARLAASRGRNGVRGGRRGMGLTESRKVPE